MGQGAATLLVAALACAISPAGASEARAMVEAFASTCAPADDGDGLLIDVPATAWRELESFAVPGLDRLVDKVREHGMIDAGGDGTFSLDVYERVPTGEDMFLLVGMISFPEGAVINCDLYRLGAEAGLDPAEVRVRFGLGEGLVYAEDGQITSSLWDDALGAGRDLYVAHVPAGSPHEALQGFSGQVMKLQIDLRAAT